MGFFPLCRRVVTVFYHSSLQGESLPQLLQVSTHGQQVALLKEFYPATEVQSQYSTTPADKTNYLMNSFSKMRVRWLHVCGGIGREGGADLLHMYRKGRCWADEGCTVQYLCDGPLRSVRKRYNLDINGR